MILLRNDQATLDPRLDRIVQFDKKSRQFPIRTLVADKKPRSYTWGCKTNLDQGSEGACVGFSWTHELNARPSVNNLGGGFARDHIYKEAQKIDESPGESYEGTSVLAGAKVVQSLGYINEYRWAFGIDDAILALGYAGPGIAGINWYRGMMNTDSNGFIYPTGGVIGGHAILVKGVNLKNKTVRLHNSWGVRWGMDGDCLLAIEDFAKLLSENGEFCIPIKRKRI